MLFAIIATYSLGFWLINFIGAYLNLKPQKDNYLEISEGFVNYYTMTSTLFSR
jgi:hypothetical protein